MTKDGREKEDVDSICISTGEKDVNKANMAETNLSSTSDKNVNLIISKGISLEDPTAGLVSDADSLG